MPAAPRVANRRGQRRARRDSHGESLAACATTGDGLRIARCDLDLCASDTNTTFNFARHRQFGQSLMFVVRKEAVPPL